MPSDLDLKKNWEEHYSFGFEKLQAFWSESLTDIRNYLGKQYDGDELAKLQKEKRDPITINVLKRSVNSLSGWQRENRLSSVILPATDEDQQTVDQMNIALSHVMNRRHGYNHISDCWENSLIAGINFSELVIDYSQDWQDGDISFARNAYNSMIWDPYFTKLDLSDCSYLTRRKFVGKAEAISLQPDHANEIKKMRPVKSDDKYPQMTFTSNPNNQDMLSYDEHWYRTCEERRFVVNMITNESFEVPRETKKKQAQQFIDDLNNRYGQPVFELITKTLPVVKLTVLINGEVFSDETDPLGINDYPFTPYVAYFTPEYNEFEYSMQSFIRAARDSQSQYNRRISKIIDIEDSRIYGGHYYKANKVLDPEYLYISGNNRSIPLKKDAVIGQDIAPINLPDVPQSLFNMTEFFRTATLDVLNLNDATFGNVENANDSGIMMQLKQSAAMIGLQPLFDNLNKSQVSETCKLVKLIQKWSPQKIARIIGEQPTPMFKDKSFSKYDITCAETVMTDHQKKLFFSQLMTLRQMGVNIPDSIILKEAPIQSKSTLIKDIKEIEQANAQAQEEARRIEMQRQILANQLMGSQIGENYADTIRQNARAVADLSLSDAHIAEAQKNSANATLDLLKSANEIEEAKSRRYRDAVDFVLNFAEKMNEQRRLEKGEDKVQSAQQYQMLKQNNERSSVGV